MMSKYFKFAGAYETKAIANRNAKYLIKAQGLRCVVKKRADGWYIYGDKRDWKTGGR